MTNKENKPILKCWVARNLNGTLGLSTEKPLRLINLGVWGVKYPGLPGHTVSMFSIDDSLFPELSWKDEAKQISLLGQWQKEQDDRLVDIIYQQGIEKGKDDMKKQMMKDAVSFYEILEAVPPGPERENVRIIIVKEENK